jgi:mRNA-degrading endonuclease RelE of RelBE toxin-antitoxin system
MNTINWKPKAAKQLKKLGSQASVVVFAETMSHLAEFPNSPSIKTLTNHTYRYRLRIGNYRVFFEYDGNFKIIYIEEVKKRNERTY